MVEVVVGTGPKCRTLLSKRAITPPFKAEAGGIMTNMGFSPGTVNISGYFNFTLPFSTSNFFARYSSVSGFLFVLTKNHSALVFIGYMVRSR